MEARSHVIKKHHWIGRMTKYGHIFKVSVMDSLVYVFDFLGRSGFFAFIIAVYLMLWSTIYGQGDGVIEGFTLNMMIWYLVLTEIITLSTTNYYREVSSDIKTGNVAYLLNKPYNYVLYSLSNNMGKILFRMFLNALVGLVIGLVFVGPLLGFSILHLPFIVITLLLGTTINYFINFTLALSAFWVEENMAFRWIYQKLVFTLGGMLLPIDLFPETLETISRRLPFAFITYGPAKLLVDFSYDSFFFVIKGQAIYLAFAIVLCFLVYGRGVKKLNVNGG